jgi:hypothetical protein
MKIFICLLWSALFAVIMLSSPAFAEPTHLTIRAKAHDAKFIGTSMAGADVQITSVPGDQILAQGVILGGTGDTARLLTNPIERYQQLSTANAAAFTTTLDIDEPTQVKISVSGPKVAGASAANQSKTLWLIPGHHLDDDGVIFEFYGLTVATVSPLPNQPAAQGQPITLTAFVTMMCGCPIQQDSLWPAHEFTVEAWLWRDNTLVKRLPMAYSGKTGVFTTTFVPTAPGGYQITFSAAQDSRGNFGVSYGGFSVK